MSEMLRVTTPVNPKDYSLNQNPKFQTQEQNFELGNVDQVNRANERDEQLGEQNLKDQTGAGQLRFQGSFVKDPAMSAVLLKGLVGGNALAALQASGNAELLNKVTEFASEILLSPEEVMTDMLRQQSESTIFSGELWGELKNMLSGLAGTDLGEEMTAAVLDFMKAAASAEARDGLLTSISASLRYLAGETAQSREVRDLLLQTADKLTPNTFSEVKGDILALVNYLEKSLLLNDKTQNLLSLITYNLSRFNNDTSSVGESFQAILNMAPDAETADKLGVLFTKFIEKSALPSDVKLNALNDSPSASAQRSMTMLTERIAIAVNYGVKKLSPEQLSEILKKALQLPASPKQADVPAETAARTGGTIRNGNAAQDISGKDIPADEIPKEEIPAESGVEKFTLQSGISALKKVFSELLPDNLKGGLNTLLREFETGKDLNTLIDRLSVIINKVDDMDGKIALAQSVNLILTDMAQAAGINYRPPTTMENMLDFLLKNINDPSLKSLAAIDRSDMIQGLLTAPGVFTPLLHFLVPMNLDGLKAFGELWADPDAGKNSETGEDDSHLFLCFEIEEAGYFEMEVYTHGKNINVSIMCPAGTEKNYSSLKDTVPAIASACGYNAEKTMVGALRRKRELNEVFPKINERRSGLSVRI